MMLVARTQRQKKSKGKENLRWKEKNKKNKEKELQNLTWTVIRGMDKKAILNSSLNKFLIPAFKIYS